MENHSATALSLSEFGQNLNDDESIEIQYGSQRLVYDQQRRKKVKVQLVQEFTRTEERVFAVSEYDKHAHSFTLLSPSGQTVKVAAGDQDSWKTTALTAFDGFESLAKNLKVLVSGTFTYNHREQLVRVQPESIELLSERDVSWRVDFLRHHNSQSPMACETLKRWLALWNGPLETLQSLEHPALYLLDGDILSAEWDRGQRPIVALHEDRLQAYSLEDDVDVEISLTDNLQGLAHFLSQALN